MGKGQLSWFILESMLWTVYKFISVVHQFGLGQFAYPKLLIHSCLIKNMSSLDYFKQCTKFAEAVQLAK
jgi:hypothetical protein